MYILEDEENSLALTEILPSTKMQASGGDCLLYTKDKRGRYRNLYFIPIESFERYFTKIDGRTCEVNVKELADWEIYLQVNGLNQAFSSVRSGKASIHVRGIYKLRQ